MELFSWYLKYLTAVCEGSLTVEGLSAEGADETEKAMDLQQKIAAMGLPAFVRRCAAAEGTQIPQRVFDEFDPAALASAMRASLETAGCDFSQREEATPETPRQNAYEAFLDCLSLEDALLEYLIDVLLREDELAFFRLSQVTVRRELRLHDFLYWLGTKELYAEQDERACATILDACMERLAEEGQLELIAALISGDRKTFARFRMDAPELCRLPQASYTWFETYYLNRYYPYRTILRLRGVKFPAFDYERATPQQTQGNTANPNSETVKKRLRDEQKSCKIRQTNLLEDNTMKKPVVLIVMDGVGKGDGGPGDAVALAKTPNLDKLFATCPYTWLKAHGTAVGLPTDEDMGNSEVGHNALGCGQIYSQGAKLVQESIDNGKLYESKAWRELTANCEDGAHTLHFLGLLSDGNVHSNISHLFALLRQAKQQGIRRVRVHALLDGRDVPATSALEYVDALEAVLAELSTEGYDYRIGSGGGRMKITMDRYQANWGMVEAGWKTHVLGQGRQFATAREAIETYRNEENCIDQDLPAFVIAENGQPIGKIENGDSVILYNFRGDRAQEISLAFDREDFDKFDRPGYTGVKFAGMLEYDGDLKIPYSYLVEPPVIRNTLTETLCKAGIHEYAISETQKYGHVTYFWNGNRSGKVDESLEVYEEIPSDIIPFEFAPKMKSKEITDRLIEQMASKKFEFLRCNYPNGDMVGHTGVIDAVVTAMEAVDESVGRVIEAAEKYGYVVCVTADHGNADQMYDVKKGKASIRTAHSLNPVPFIIWDPDNKHSFKDGKYGLANVAPTVVKLLGIEAPACWEACMIAE